jgi:hypothetical protein
MCYRLPNAHVEHKGIDNRKLQGDVTRRRKGQSGIEGIGNLSAGIVLLHAYALPMRGKIRINLLKLQNRGSRTTPLAGVWSCCTRR